MKRKQFLKLAGLTSLASTASISGFATTSDRRQAADLQLGLASYTLRKLSLEDVIKTAVRLNLKGIALKSMHMPLEASAEETKAAARAARCSPKELKSRKD